MKEIPDMNNGFLTVKDMSIIFEISTQAVYEWMKDKRLKFYQISNTKRIKPDDLLQYLKDRGNSPGTMKDFEFNIKNYLAQKRIHGKQFYIKLRDLEKGR